MPAERRALLDSLIERRPAPRGLARSPRTSICPEGYIEFIGASQADPIALRDSPVAKPEEVLNSLRGEWRDLLVAPRQPFDFLEHSTSTGPQGRRIRLRQAYRGIPVFGSELLVNINRDGRLVSLRADLLRDALPFETGKYSLTPRVGAEEARRVALDLFAAHPVKLSVSSPELMIYDPALLQVGGMPQLAWRCVVSSSDAPLREVALVNAWHGRVIVHYSEIKDALVRQINDAGNSGEVPGPLARQEGDPPTSITDVDRAYDITGDAYNFYFNQHGRDGIDGAGAPLLATVRLCDSLFGCPYRNAYWDQGRAYFGEGYAAADDVVAHEMTHGVTESESDLIYLRESGALNESLSDVWGEFVDLVNGTGNDSAGVRWLIGEDLPVGAIRNMANPPAFSDPDRMLSTFYYHGTADNGGVHSNSGVNNKLCTLLTDGGNFNGHAIAPMGIPRVAALYYEVQTGLLTQSSTHYDLYLALTQAAVNLGWNEADRENLESACQAVEINLRLGPKHDDCATAICVGDEVALTTSTLFASGPISSSCTSDSLDVWHRYTPRLSEPVTIETELSDFDTTLAVYSDCGTTELACNDDIDTGGGNYNSRVTLNLIAGLTYYIRVAGWGSQSGEYTLRVTGGLGDCADQPSRTRSAWNQY